MLIRLCFMEEYIVNGKPPIHGGYSISNRDSNGKPQTHLVHRAAMVINGARDPGRVGASVTRTHSMMSSSSSSHNEIQISKEFLLTLLTELSVLVFQEFGCQIRLFIHGGAVMILHPNLSTSSSRRTTRDINYLRRAFGHEWRKRRVYDAEERLQRCINAVAAKFRMGTDWMNADPDVALPFAHSTQGQLYDPIYHDSKQPNNIDMNTVYRSPGLVVISVTMFWGVALKLVRYRKEDPTDIVAMLRHGTKLNGIQWTPDIMETWIKTLCWPMGYNTYKPQQAEELRNRIHDAVHHLLMSLENSPEESSHMALIPSTVQSPPVSSTTRSPVLSSLHTMSSSLAPHPFSQPPSPSSLHSIDMSSHSVSPPVLSSVHTMSSSLTPHPFSQPPSASSLHSIYLPSHSVSPPAFIGERTRRSSTNFSRHQTFSPPIPLTSTSSQSSHSVSHPTSHSHPPSHSQSSFRMPEPWPTHLPLIIEPMMPLTSTSIQSSHTISHPTSHFSPALALAKLFPHAGALGNAYAIALLAHATHRLLNGPA
ncbi:hypothetical protein EV702DRAFT_1281956 [Suillus placidus]|uniref:Uncharacterized protein n=1 Tax=Suillus placidus TaxID=48579 RepID=A0A9P6ZKS5_9AGAM|nr:hypothetical protein EV702DRAFT_1281956 [Suillus placidus]